MRHRPGAWWWPLRVAFGLFFLHTAASKRELDERGRKGLQRFAASAYPVLRDVEPATFVKAMTVAETTVAATLLVPVVPAPVGAAALTAFGTGLLGAYGRIPGMRREGSLRPSELGMGMAKDSWMVAAGVAVLVDATAATIRARGSRGTPSCR